MDARIPEAKTAALRPGVVLQPQQRRIADRVAGGDDLLVYHQVGAGKSLAGIAAAEAAGSPYAFVSPAALRTNTTKELDRFAAGDTPVSILSYEQVARGQAPDGPLGTLVVDECLPLGTPVDGRPIESIRPGDVVNAVDHATGRVVAARVLRTASRLTDEIAVVALESGRRIVCTPNHPIYTSHGYVPSESLCAGDIVFRLLGVDCVGPSGASRDAQDDGPLLSELRVAFRGLRLPIERTEALLRRLPERRSCEDGSEFAQEFRPAEPTTHAYGQSDEGPGLPRKGGPNAPEDRASTRDPRRQWAGADAAGSRDGQSPGLGNRGGRHHAAPAAVPAALQDRRRRPRDDDGDRDRRAFARRAEPAGAGRQEDSVLVLDRVAGVSIHECGGGSEFEQLCPGGVVFDLTVEGCHNFFADGYLVHNSHNLKNPDSARSRAVADLAARAGRKVLLTGTPIVNSPGDLAGPLSILTGERITPGEFESRFVGRERAPRGLMGVIRGVPAGYRPVMRDVRGLERLLRGKVDYHAPTAPPVNEQDERIEVDLGRDQANLHNWMWGKLPAITRWKLSRSYPLTSTEVANLSGFMTGPRQAATSTLPFMRGRETSPLRAFQRSTKLQRAVSEFEKELATNSEAKALIFSNFIDAGLSPYAAALEARKIPHGVFKGGLSDKARKQLVADYNEGKLRALLLGPSGSEGLSTRRTTLIQQLDPHWNETRGRQNKGRGIRFDSHADLPPEERNVRVQRFISRMPQGRLARLLGRKPRPTADEVLERMSAEKERLNEQFREVLRRVGSERSEVGGEKEAAAPALVELRRAKAMSDRRDFKGKHQVLRRLMQEQPGAFFVDDPRGHFVGVTHRDLGFRVHLPRNLIPAGVEGLSPAAPKAAAALVMEAATRRKKSPTGPSAAAIDRVPEVPAEPSPDDALALALEGVRARRRRATRPPASRPKVAAGLADATDFAARYFIPALAGTAGVTSQNPLIGAAVGAVGGGLLSLPGILDERSRILASRPGRRPSGADRRAARKSLGARLSLGLLPGAAVGALSGAAGHALIHKDAAADLRRVKTAGGGDDVLRDAALGAAALGLAGGGVGWAGSRILGDVEDIARWVARRKPAPPRDHVGAALRMGGIGAVLGGAIGAAAAASPAASAPENAKSLASVVGRYYENAPGKFDGAVDRAVASRKDVPGFGALGFTAEDAKTGIPVEVSPAVTAGADGQTTMGRFVRPRVRVLPQTSIGTKADAKYVLEHELSHAALDGLPMRRGESAVQRGGGPAADGAAYFRSPSELIPRVADVKRKWVAAHPGRDVTTPEEAAEALDWFIKQRPNGARDADTLDGWGMGKSPSWWSAFGGGSEDSPEVEALRARILSLMPQLVRNLVPRDGTKTAAEYADVPAMVAARIKAAEAPTWPDGDVLADPAALADRIAIGALAAAPRIPLLGLEKLAADAQSVSTGLFTPSIPVDAFNRVVWNDVWGANPLGTRPAHGSADARLGTPAPVAAAVSGLVAGAGAARGSDRVSPWDVATAAGAGGAGGWLGGLVLGRTVGALAGLPPEAQSRMQDVGLWGGLLAGAVRGVFGKGR